MADYETMAPLCQGLANALGNHEKFLGVDWTQGDTINNGLPYFVVYAKSGYPWGSLPKQYGGYRVMHSHLWTKQ